MRALVKKILSQLCPSIFHTLRIRSFTKKTLPKDFVKNIEKLNANSVAIDVGANIGLVSEVMAKTGARVIAFEPNKRALKELRDVAIRYPNIEVNEVAAGTKAAKVKLYLHKDSERTHEDLTQASSLMSEKPNVSKRLFQDVDEIDFAHFLINIDTDIDLLKIDIEGYEIELINHLIDKSALLNVAKVYVETHERKFVALTEATDRMKRRVEDFGLSNKFFWDWH